MGLQIKFHMVLSEKDFEESFRCYYRPLCMFSLRIVKDIDQAEDIVQDAFVDLWEKKDSLKDSSNIRAYLFSVVRNKSTDYLKKISSIEMSYDISLIEEEQMEQIIEDSFSQARILTAIDNLPERCKHALLLSKRDGLKYEEIAENMSVSVNTVRNHISKALKLIKESTRKLYMFILA